MECNRDEALRAREIAERKFLAKDLKGAKKFALKAKNLYPELEGISQMVMTLEVYISAENERMNGESNWYGVLGLTPLADEDAIRKQYRKLALLLHPDKNRSIGAEGAFQFISQAWNLLSDKSKKTAYDQRCGRLFQQGNQTKNEGPSPPSQNGFYNFANTATSQMKTQKVNTSNGNPSAVPRPPRKKHRQTFWTVCHRCKMQYEYLRNYLNHNLLCPNCHEAYFAVEIDPPSTSIKIPSQTSNSHQNNFQWVPFSESSGAQSAVKAANMVQQAYEKVKRERQKAQAAARREEALRRKNNASKRTIVGDSSGNPEAKRRKGAEDCGVNKDKMKYVNGGSGNIHQVNNSGLKQDNLQKRVRLVDLKHVVIEKAREEIHRKLNECISAAVVSNVASENSHINKKEGEASTKNDSLVTRGFMCRHNNLCETLEAEKNLPLNELGFGPSDCFSENKLAEHMCVDVLESDFHDFDKSRTEHCFSVNQVWAVYDDDDGMPRHYAMIKKVISLNPFKVSMSLLSSTTHSRLGNGSWFLSGFLRPYGEFGVGRHEICCSIDCFSHKVRWRKHSSKTILIYPRKGDVWALYRNWSPEWNELTEHEVLHKYDMVEVLEDCDEELGVIVIPLVKVAGFKTVFHQHIDPREIRRIPKEELSRFSHQVPSHLLDGQEELNSPKGCLELDPAAIPSEFLQLMSDIEAVEFMVTGEDIEIVKAVDGDGTTKPNMIEDFMR